MKKAPYDVLESKKLRVIIDTDANCECDDQYVIAHAMLTPKLEIKGIVGAPYLPLVVPDSADKSYEEIVKVLKLMDMENSVPVLKGSNRPLTDEKTPQISKGADFILKEALRDDPRPLFVVCQAAITNLASAYLMNPEIAKKVIAVWTSGGKYPKGGWEFNVSNDVNAANVIFDSPLRVWQVPMNVYTLMKVSFAELWEKVSPCGAIGEYLYKNTLRVNHDMTELIAKTSPWLNDDTGIGFPAGESWQLGDSPLLGLLLTDHEFHYDIMPAPRFNADFSYTLRPDNPRKIRVYNYVDSRYILEDMFAKLKYYYGEKK